MTQYLICDDIISEKAEVQELRSRLPHHQHIMYGEIELLEPVGSGELFIYFEKE